MEFNEKLQELRKQKGLTQEELANALFVSRTAVSKWESGRGYPSIDSLKAISKLFSVSIDQLLSGDELLTAAEEDNIQKSRHLRDLVFGLMDISCILLLFLPLFAQRTGGTISDVSLLQLDTVAPYVKTAYFALIALIIVCGILALALQNCNKLFWLKNSSIVSLILTMTGILLFTLSLQPYAAVFLFVFSAIKVLMIIKK
ncbi:MAG: helix-turn-helix transcriptional regulator [Oscillospiraceae bacterium]|nr:helix-turn-helix transcriptional regulator [Oscillospiraceae bacterium]